MESIWKKSVQMPSFPHLSGDLRTDVLVIGGGMTGLLCADMLHRAGVDCTVLEAANLCSGTTGNTTAKITLQHSLIYKRVLSSYGKELAQQYLQANRAAMARYKELCSQIPCGYRELPAAVYSLRSRKKIEDEVHSLNDLGYPAQFSVETELPFPVVGAAICPNQAQFHPLQFASAIASPLRIFEHTPVRELVGNTAITDFGRVFADTIIVATHFPFINKHGAYFLKLYQHRSYVLSLRGVPIPGTMYVDEAKDGLSFRGAEDCLLLGGGGHRTGKKGGGWQALRSFARQYYPMAKETTHWAAQDCMSLDGIPYIGQYSPRTEGLYTATGFQKWGMTTSMVAAMLLCDMVQGRHSPYQEVFSPSRRVLHPQLGINALEAAGNLILPTRRRCPHLGCALKWNPQEHSWDCPCHGSRFTPSGHLIDNPATSDMKKPPGNPDGQPPTCK